MLVLLPPSETKAPGGADEPLSLDELSYPELTSTRRKLTEELCTLAEDVPASLRVLGLSERQTDEVRRNAELWQAPTMPALERYTGVLYDALDIGSLTKAERERANVRLAVASALFGLVHASDRIPAYRLSGGSTLPALGSLRALWRPVLEPVLAERTDLVVDLRSGTYANLARVPGAIGVRVLSENSRGQRKIVSHHNKAHKGRFARVLTRTRREPATVDELVMIANNAGLIAEREAEHQLCLVVPA